MIGIGQRGLIDVRQLLLEARAASDAGYADQSESLIREALRLEPTHPEALAMLALAAFNAKRSREALSIITDAIKLMPERGDFHFVQGIASAQMGDIDGALAGFRRAIRRDPGMCEAWTNLVFGLDLHYATTWTDALAIRRQFNQAFCAERTATAAPHRNDPTPDRKIRVGYVGADFRAHSAAGAFGPVVLNHGPDFLVHAYFTGKRGSVDDEATRAFRESVLWRDVDGLTPEQMAERIRRDRIDILVDLAGFSAGGALRTFACRPAPVQVTAWGYLTGTGLDCMDYILADEVTIPREHGRRYAEHIVHLPACLAYSPPGDDLELGPPPELVRGYRTYGYLGRPSKITTLAFDAWGKILTSRPDARMFLKSDQYVDRDQTHRVINALVARGVDPAAIEVQGLTPRAEHVLAHNQVDVCLDTFPQTGGATIGDALWMGVPLVTLAGDRVSNRIGASLNHVVRRDQDTAERVEEYIMRAVTMPVSLDERAAIRAAMKQSPVIEHGQYARLVEQAYRMMWRRWCEQRAGSAAA